MISNIPDEVLISMLANFSSFREVLCFSNVCTRFAGICSTKFIWQKKTKQYIFGKHSILPSHKNLKEMKKKEGKQMMHYFPHDVHLLLEFH